MRWRSEVVLAVTLLGGVMPRLAVAQALGSSTACACFVATPGTPTPSVPGIPGTLPEPDGADALPGESSNGGSSNKAPWAFLGAAGLALLSGVPFGGSVAAGPLLGALPTGPETLASTTGTPLPEPPIERAGTTDLPPASPSTRSGTGGGDAAPGDSVLAAADSLREPARPGLVAPKTATHLPLFGAAGVLMTGLGVLLARRSSRQQRRRRRLLVVGV